MYSNYYYIKYNKNIRSPIIIHISYLQVQISQRQLIIRLFLQMNHIETTIYYRLTKETRRKKRSGGITRDRSIYVD